MRAEVLRGRVKTLFLKPAVIVTLVTLMVFSAILGLRIRGDLEFLELAAYDWFIRGEPKLPAAESRITLIEISEQDIQSIGQWPLTDEMLARALRTLLRYKPRAIGLDIYRDIPVPPGTAELNSLFGNNPALIGVMTVGAHGIAPLAVIRNTEQAAAGDVVVDPGGIVRRGLLFLDDGRNSYNSFALRLAGIYLEGEGISLQPDPTNPSYVRLKGTTIKPLEGSDGGYSRADARGYQLLLDYSAAGVPFRSYSLAALLDDKVPAAAIDNKLVLIGVNAQSVKDHFFTPLSRGDAQGRMLSGIELHAHVAGQLLRIALDGASPTKTPPEWQKSLWLLWWGLLGTLAGYRNRSTWRFSAATGGGLLFLCGIAFVAFRCNWWLPVVPPALSFFISSVGVAAVMNGLEMRERAMLMLIFAKHVSPEVAGMIWRQRDQFLDNGRPRSRNMTVTVFFSDLRGFTSVSEQLAPQELMDWLNTYMESMAGLIMAHGGVVDSYAGDGIKADFGVPLPRDNDDEIRRDAINAVTCAVAMEQEMHKLNAIWREKGLPPMGIRVGIYTGPVVGGLLGSSQRLKYTTIGDTVNVASRLESFDKEVGKESLCRILIGDATNRLLGEDFITEKIREVCLKGKDEKTAIYRVFGRVQCNNMLSRR